MKNFYFTLLFVGFSFFVSAQDLEGTPVQGLKPIKRTPNALEKISNTRSQVNQTAKILPASAITPTGTSTEVGITEGQLSVSLTGGASYSIPIAMSPGINGVVPQVSLTYNSQGGNGVAGYGWNISGVSAITRIPSTKFHDGTIDAVDFDNLDRFAFDGQRLIVSAKEQLVLRCGKASITLTKAGKVLVEGTYLLSRSTGVNRVKGGSVQLN